MSQVAFLDVDTQFDFVQPGGKLYAQGAEAIAPNLARLVRYAREQRLPLIASVDAHAEGDAEFSEYPPHCLRGTDGQQKLPETCSEAMTFVPSEPLEADALPDPVGAHPVLEKQQFSLFTNPNAEALFGKTGAETFIVFGVVTEVCVRQAVLGLLERGYAVRLVEDAIWPISAEGGAQALEEMQAKGAVLTTTDAVVGSEAAV